MLSLKQTAQQCMGVSGEIRVHRDIYGYIFRDAENRIFGPRGRVDILPGTKKPTARSLKRQLQLLHGDCINVCYILVGHDPGFTGVVTPDQATLIQYATQVMRDIYAQVNVGVRAIFWQVIPTAAAGLFAAISDGAEATALTNTWSAPHDGIDVFWVQSIGTASGYSNSDGPCDKNEDDERTGAVIELSNGRLSTGITLAHEVGHYLTLTHGTTPEEITNVMGWEPNTDGGPSTGIGTTDLTSLELNVGQGLFMKKSCWMRGPC